MSSRKEFLETLARCERSYTMAKEAWVESRRWDSVASEEVSMAALKAAAAKSLIVLGQSAVYGSDFDYDAVRLSDAGQKDPAHFFEVILEAMEDGAAVDAALGWLFNPFGTIGCACEIDGVDGFEIVGTLTWEA